jgi:uncharacterized membrane protein
MATLQYGHSGLTNVVDRNVEALVRMRRERESRRGVQQRVADWIGDFAGSLTFVYIHFFFFGGWLLVNSGVVPGVRPFDPFPFVMLAMWASVEAIFLSTFVLINQNRQNAVAEMRADLDLQVSLLTEHELTRLVHMVDAISDRLGVPHNKPDDLEEIKQDVPPEIVLERLEKEGSSEV